MGRPVLFVLAVVNGAGKSSVGGQVLVQAGLDGFNLDSVARELLDLIGCSQADANTLAWTEGLRRLDEAGHMAATGHDHPHLPRQLRGQAVKLQRAEQADHRLRQCPPDSGCRPRGPCRRGSSRAPMSSLGHQHCHAVLRRLVEFWQPSGSSSEPSHGRYA